MSNAAAERPIVSAPSVQHACRTEGTLWETLQKSCRHPVGCSWRPDLDRRERFALKRYYLRRKRRVEEGWGERLPRSLRARGPDVSDLPTALSNPATSRVQWTDRKSTRLNSSHVKISYAVFCLKKK